MGFIRTQDCKYFSTSRKRSEHGTRNLIVSSTTTMSFLFFILQYSYCCLCMHIQYLFIFKIWSPYTVFLNFFMTFTDMLIQLIMTLPLLKLITFEGTILILNSCC